MTFRQYKFLPADSPTWYTTDDNLAGTAEVGIEGDNTAEWAIKFDTI